MNTGDKRAVYKRMFHSDTGAHWLAGLEVEILEMDHGESWEPTIVKVRAKNEQGKPEDVWMNPLDFVASEGAL